MPPKISSNDVFRAFESIQTLLKATNSQKILFVMFPNYWKYSLQSKNFCEEKKIDAMAVKNLILLCTQTYFCMPGYAAVQCIRNFDSSLDLRAVLQFS